MVHKTYRSVIATARHGFIRALQFRIENKPKMSYNFENPTIKEAFYMKYLRQILVILLLSFLGEVLHALIPWPIPASIYGMLLLFIALSLKIIRVEQVKDAGNFLVTFLPVLFVAPIVSLLDCWDQLSENLLPILLILIGSTVLCFAVSGRVAQWVIRRKEKRHG